jgi:hypothetical protein
MEITIKKDIPLSRIADLLCDALEGGANYWYSIEKYIKPPKITFRSGENDICAHLDYPLNKGGAILIQSLAEPEKGLLRLDLPVIQRGLELLASKKPAHWADFLNENNDADTGDVFLQLCLFGDVIYG